MSQILPFDPAAFRRVVRPYLLGSLVLSLLGDVCLYLGYRQIAEHRTVQAVAFGSMGLLFLFVLNIGLKVCFFYLYQKNMRRWKNSYLQIEQDEVIHYIFCDQMTREELDAADEKTPWSFYNPKEVYVRADYYHIRRVQRVKRRLDGTLIVVGSVDRQIRNEYVQSDPLNPVDQWELGLHRHAIPAFYRSPDGVENTLRQMAHRASGFPLSGQP